MGRLTGKSAFITGAGSGIGRAAAVLFAKEGAQVAVCDINEQAAEETASEARSAGPEIVVVHADITDERSAQAGVELAVRHFGRLDTVYNNAGGSTLNDGPVTEAPIGDQVHRDHLLGWCEPIHIAYMALYLASDESMVTTGQVLPVDSGITIW